MKRFLKKNWKLILAILYLLSPIDIIPDIVPVVGVSDDLAALVLALVLRYLEYRKEAVERNKQTSRGIPKGEILEGELVE